MPRSTVSTLAVASATVIFVAALAACTAKSSTAINAAGPTAAGTTPSVSTSPTQAPTAAVVQVSTADGATSVNPVQPVRVTVTGGQLTAVTLTNPEGKVVRGAVSADHASWSSAEDLGYAKTYRLTAAATNPEGTVTNRTASFTTVQPANLTMAYINTAAGQAINPGDTFGVGQVVRIHFDEPIPNRKAAQNAITVDTSPKQVGGFSWLSDQDVYWRTKDYLRSGTRVTVTAKLYGASFGNGLYGQADTSTWFKVGDKHVSIADDNTKLIKVYDNDKLVRTMPTSMGRHTSIPGDHGLIDLRTNSGPHVVVGGETNINMNSASFGLSKGANAYKTIVPVGVRISYDGEYVHWADWSVWAQGNTDTSHGCLNVSPDNSWWYYHFSVPGDIVDVRSTGRPLQEWNSGYWTVSWSTWLAGGAR